MYGAILNPGCRFSDQRIGQSTTLTGRTIAKHMDAYVNECITGEYDHVGKAIVYGDSVTGDTLIDLHNGQKVTIEDLFNSIQYKVIQDSGKEYAIPTDAEFDLKVLGFNSAEDTAVFGKINYVMRHKTSKQLYKITTDSGKHVTVTEDHSVMIDNDGFTVETKPLDIKVGTDCVFVPEYSDKPDNQLLREIVTNVEEFNNTDDVYVYDISIRDQDPVFIGNSIALKNTDSCYFSAWPIIKNDVESGKLEWNRDIAVQLYDSIAEQVNESFPTFMTKAFNCPEEMGQVLKCGREIVAEHALFIKKKRYAAVVYDLEGDRLDLLDEKTANKKGVVYTKGKLKALGLDLKRSDTPKIVQDFLKDILFDVLDNATKEEIYEKIKNFKVEFKNKPSWEKGTPKRVNNLTMYSAKEEKNGKSTMPGHVRAAINWNTLRRLYGDNNSMVIVDGMKTIVCKLKNNPAGITSIGYPVDQPHLPDWFKELPFDDSDMEATIVDQKVDNLLGVLNWDIANNTNIESTLNSLFTFK